MCRVWRQLGSSLTLDAGVSYKIFFLTVRVPYSVGVNKFGPLVSDFAASFYALYASPKT